MQGYYRAEDCDPDEFRALIARQTAADDVSNAARIEKNIPVYDVDSFRDDLSNPGTRFALMAEWAWVLGQGPGVFALSRAYADTAPIDAATALFEDIIAREKAASGDKADHFAGKGANDRIWNSLQKLCEADAEVFVRYHAQPAIDAACEAWLGPNYQMTAQVNLVHPGGAAQQAHRDYHLGFQTAEVSALYPAHVHHLSPLMTLQGAIAHCDMPIESGPTKLLPFSQLYRPGYAAWRRDDFREIFEEACVQLPLKKGDALFFNPALFHAAGANVSEDIHRMANLVQISSAMGRAMETIDRAAMSLTILGPLQRLDLSEAERHAAIAATAEGYSFPTNLDNDPPVGGLAPKTMADYLREAVAGNRSRDALAADLDAMKARQSA